MTGEPILTRSACHERCELETRDYYHFNRQNRDGTWWQLTVPKARLSEDEFYRWKHRQSADPHLPPAVCLRRLSPEELRFVSAGSVPIELRQMASVR